MKTDTIGLSRRRVLALFVAGSGASLAALSIRAAPGRAASLPLVEVWKDARCECCGAWAQHMRGAGFPVTVADADDMDTIRKAKGVPADLQSCHTALVDGYVVEGHVPPADVKRLLAERPLAKGLAAPGMPQSAPGMDQPGEPYAVILFGAPAGNRTYSSYPG